MGEPFKVLICGSRSWHNPYPIYWTLDGLLDTYGDRLIVINGYQVGADQMADNWARDNGLTIENGRLLRFPADWKKYSKGAGPIRNRQMLREQPNLVWAFHDSETLGTGTKDMVSIAEAAQIPVMRTLDIRSDS